MTESEATTTKHGWWLLHKERQRQERKQDRGVAVTIAEVRKKSVCIDTCNHTRKHHTKTGHCRPGCDCKAGMR